MESVNDAFTYTERYAAQVDRVRVRFEHRDYSRYRLTTNGLVREGELRTEQGYKADETATVYVLNSERPAGEQIRYVKLTQKPEYLYLVDSAGDLVLGTPLTIEN